jgi:aspartate aminotransferase-like enzyme
VSEEKSRFFVPGPTWVRPEILEAMTGPMVGHRSAAFSELFISIAADLKELFRTTQHTFIATSSGTGLMEGALYNCVPRRLLVTTCGAFSERWMHIAQQSGLEVDHLDHPWGEPVNPDRLARHIGSRRQHYDAVTITHNETSTGVINDLETLSAVVHAESPGTLVLVDAVSSLGSAPVLFDEWKLDVCFASVQKGLALPPGLTVFAVSEQAMAAAANKRFRGTYFDFLLYQKNAADGSTPFTPSLPHCYALATQLDSILRNETLERRWERHARMRELTLERTARHSTLASRSDSASPSVSALSPLDLAAPEVVRRMKERGFILGGGYGQWKPSTYRIGHMGDISIESLTEMLDVLEETSNV